MSVLARRSRARPVVRLARAPLLLGLANVGLLGVLAVSGGQPMGAAIVAAAAFWGVLAAYPQTASADLLLSPRNWVLALFFSSMIIGAAVMPFDDTINRRLFFLTYARYNTSVWTQYALPAALVWATGLAAYAFGLRAHDRKPAAKRRTLGAGEPAAVWMLLGGILLVALGILGLAIAAGSLARAIEIAGIRAAAGEVLATSEARFTAFWMEGVPIGAALIWYWGMRSFRLGGLGSVGLLVALYVPLFPLYLYTGGRAIALIPALILLALYHRFVRQFSVWWIGIGVMLILPVMSVWAEYRLTGVLHLDSLSGMLTVITGDFSRFDITVAALAGVHEARMPPYWGETLLSATTLWLPSQLRPDLVDGTLALFRVLVGDPTSTVRSPYASTLVVEGYLNFRIPGVLLFGYVLGRSVAVLDGMARSGSVLTVLIAFVLAVRLPVAVSVDQGVLLIIRALLGPLLLIKGIQLVLSVRRRPRRARSASTLRPPALADASA